jgi:transcriptional regulator with XRE-family HTH domain
MTLLRLGALLRERRGGRGLREVAGEIGISPATLTRVEAGRLPDIETFKRICQWLKVNPAEILGIDVSSPNSPSNEPALPAVAFHPRADRTLPPEAANDLAQLIVAAHRELLRRARERGTDVSSRL